MKVDIIEIELTQRQIDEIVKDDLRAILEWYELEVSDNPIDVWEREKMIWALNVLLDS